MSLVVYFYFIVKKETVLVNLEPNDDHVALLFVYFSFSLCSLLIL